MLVCWLADNYFLVGSEFPVIGQIFLKTSLSLVEIINWKSLNSHL